MTVQAIVVDCIVDGVDVGVGMDVIGRLGGVTVNRNGGEFGGVRSTCPGYAAEERGRGSTESGSGERNAADRIEDKDFRAEFDGERWTVEWFWKGEPPTLTNKVSCYENTLKGEARGEFEREVDRWIEEGILIPWKEEVKSGVLALMAVVQPTKNKVRPVLDFREMNDHVSCHTGGDAIDVCGETLRQWRQAAGASTIVDLKSAYL